MNSNKLTSAQFTSQERSSAATPASPAATGLTPRLGNHYLQRLLQSRMLQAKLTVSDPGDAFEQEADRVADRVMRMPAHDDISTTTSPVAVRRKCAMCEDELQRSEVANDHSAPTVDVATEQAIDSLSGRGHALPESVRSFMEPRFNADFSAVRIHTDAHAQRLARSVDAQAFTVGGNVVFGAGRYSPESDGGKRLLAHELTHVVQQAQQRGHPAAVQRKEDTGVEESTPKTTGRPATIVRIEAETNETGTVRAFMSDGSERLVSILRNKLEAGEYNISPAGPRQGPKDAEYLRREGEGFAWRQLAADAQPGDVVKVVIKRLPEDRFARLPAFIRNYLLAGRTHVSVMEMARLAEEGEALLREGTTEEILALAADPDAAIKVEGEAPPDPDLVESLRRRGFSDFPSREEYYRRLAWQLVNSSDYRRWWTQADIEGYWKQFPEEAAGDWEKFAGKHYAEAKHAEEAAWLEAFRRIDAAAGAVNAIAVVTIFVAGGFAGAQIVALPSISIPALPATIGGVKTTLWAKTLFAAGVSSSFLNHIFNRSKEAAATEGGSNPISIFSAAVLDTSGVGEVYQAATNESLLTGEDLGLSKTERAVGAIKGTADFLLNFLGAKDLLGDPIPQVKAPAKVSTQPPPEPTPVAVADTKQSVGISGQSVAPSVAPSAVRSAAPPAAAVRGGATPRIQTPTAPAPGAPAASATRGTQPLQPTRVIVPSVESKVFVRGFAREGPSAPRTGRAGPNDITTQHPHGVPRATPTETTHAAPQPQETETVVGGFRREPSRRPVQPKDPVVVGGPGREPGRTSEPAKDAVVVGGPGRQPGRTSEPAKDAVVVGGPGRQPGRTSEPAQDPVSVGGLGREASRPPDVPETLPPSDGVPIAIGGPEDTTGVRTNPVPRPGPKAPPSQGTTPPGEAVPEHIDDGPSDGVPREIDDHQRTTNRVSTPAPIARGNARLQVVGEYRFIGTEEMGADGVLHRHIGALEHIGGPTTSTVPFDRFFRALIDGARAAGARVLRITGEFPGNPNVGRLNRYLAQFGGAAHVEGTAIEIVIPLAAR